MNNSIDVMIDIETTGTSSGCCILSIGATSFDEKYTFYMKIDHRSSVSYGLKDSPGTMAWWQQQSSEARMEAFSGTDDLVVVLGAFSDFLLSIQRAEGEVFIWGNGADFDLPIIKAAYEIVDMPVPWKPFNGRCYRTLKNLPQNKNIKADKFEGVKHNALADAIFQARHALKILRETKQIELF